MECHLGDRALAQVRGQGAEVAVSEEKLCL